MSMIESAMCIRFPAATSSFSASNASFTYYRPMWSLDDSNNAHFSSCRISHSPSFQVLWSRNEMLNGGLLARRKTLYRNKFRACAGQMGSFKEPGKAKGKSGYHPSEDIAELTSVGNGDARLTPAETTRTIIEVNSKAALLFSGLFGDEAHEKVFWPDLPYVSDEHGNMYFKVNNDEDILQSLASDNNFVQVLIGLENMEMFNDIDLSGPADIDFVLDEIDDEDLEDEDDDGDGEEDEDDDYDEDWVSVLDEDEYDPDETIGDWAKLETMRYSHPMYFARKMAEAASDKPIDWMEKPAVGLCIQGFLTPAFLEEHSAIQKHRSDHQSSGDNIHLDEKVNKAKVVDLGRVNGFEDRMGSEDDSTSEEELEKDESPRSGTSFYKLEMIRIQLLLAHGNPTFVDVEDYRKAKPDAIAHSAANIISRFKAGGEKTEQALKSLCWRCKGIQVEEAALISVDSLGFDLRLCSGTQVQTLRFAFDTRATSEYSAERQLTDLLFPRVPKPTRKKQPQQNER